MDLFGTTERKLREQVKAMQEQIDGLRRVIDEKNEHIHRLQSKIDRATAELTDSCIIP